MAKRANCGVTGHWVTRELRSFGKLKNLDLHELCDKILIFRARKMLAF
jgi:hypothetical protein